MTKNEIILEAKKIGKYFYEPEKFRVLDDISFEVKRGEFVSLVGKSGCGKSTLLYVLSTMDTDYEGDLRIHNQSVTGMKQNQLAGIRNEKIGFVFQFHYLLPEFTVLDNVKLPAIKLGKLSEAEIEAKAYEKLDILGLRDQALKRANKLSGGQQQRVAIARALINDPEIIFGDEPTGNLDSKNTAIVLDIFKDLRTRFHQNILVVTHDMNFANNTDRMITLKDGEVIEDKYLIEQKAG